MGGWNNHSCHLLLQQKASNKSLPLGVGYCTLTFSHHLFVLSGEILRWELLMFFFSGSRSFFLPYPIKSCMDNKYATDIKNKCSLLSESSIWFIWHQLHLMIMTQSSVTSKSCVFKLLEKESIIYRLYREPYNACYFSIQVNLLQ